MVYEVNYIHEIIAEERVIIEVEADSEAEAEEKALSGNGYYITCEICGDHGETKTPPIIENITLIKE